MPILWVFETDVSDVFCIKRNVGKISSCLLKTFFLKQVPLNTPQENERRKEKEEGRKETKKRKSKFCFLRMPEFGKVIFCIWIRILRRSTISKRSVRTFKLSIARQRLGNCATSFKTPRFLGKIDRGKWLSFGYSLLSLFMAASLVLTGVT